MQYVIAALIGLVSGMTSGLFGVGGGVVMVPAMMFFMGLPIDKAIGTSLAVIIPTAISGTLKHHHQQNVDWFTAATLIPTAMIGGVVGAKLTDVISAPDLKRIFGGFLVIVGLRLLFFK